MILIESITSTKNKENKQSPYNYHDLCYFIVNIY